MLFLDNLKTYFISLFYENGFRSLGREKKDFLLIPSITTQSCKQRPPCQLHIPLNINRIDQYYKYFMSESGRVCTENTDVQ
jgi:hypothetical protein